MKRWIVVGSFVTFAMPFILMTGVLPTADAQDTSDDRIAALETQVAEHDDQINSLRRRISALEAAAQETAPSAGETAPPSATDTPSETPSGAQEPDAEPAGAAQQGFLSGNAFDLLPLGVEGELAVVTYGAYDGFILPLLVRNNTANDLTELEVTATVRNASGQLIAVGAATDLTPEMVVPGSYAFGSAYFDGAALPSDATYEFQVVGESPSSAGFLGQFDLTITESSYLGDRIVGTARNDQAFAVIGPIGVDAACFAPDGGLVGIASDYAEAESVDPGVEIPYQIALYGIGSCDILLVGASGYNF